MLLCEETGVVYSTFTPLRDLKAVLISPDHNTNSVTIRDDELFNDQELAATLRVITAAFKHPHGKVREITTTIKGPASLKALCDLLTDEDNTIAICTIFPDDDNPVTTNAACDIADALKGRWSVLFSLQLGIPCSYKALYELSRSRLRSLSVLSPAYSFGELLDVLRGGCWTVRNLHLRPIPLPDDHDELAADAVADGNRNLLHLSIYGDYWPATCGIITVNGVMQRLQSQTKQ